MRKGHRAIGNKAEMVPQISAMHSNSTGAIGAHNTDQPGPCSLAHLLAYWSVTLQCPLTSGMTGNMVGKENASPGQECIGHPKSDQHATG